MVRSSNQYQRLFLRFFFFFLLLDFLLLEGPAPGVISSIVLSSAMDSSAALKSISSRLCRFIWPVGCDGVVFSIVFDRSLRSFLISVNREARTFPSSLELPPPAMPIPSRPSTKDSGSNCAKQGESDVQMSSSTEQVRSHVSKIFHSLADTNQLDGKSQLSTDSNDASTLGAAV